MIPGVEVVPPIEVVQPAIPVSFCQGALAAGNSKQQGAHCHPKKRKKKKEKEKKKKKKKFGQRIPCVVLGCVPVTIGVIFV